MRPPLAIVTSASAASAVLVVLAGVVHTTTADNNEGLEGLVSSSIVDQYSGKTSDTISRKPRENGQCLQSRVLKLNHAIDAWPPLC